MLDTVLTVVVAAVGFEQAGPIEQRLGPPASAVILTLFVTAYLVAGFFAFKGAAWSFWLALGTFGVTAVGVVVVPLRGVESGVMNPVGVTLAMVNDGAAAVLVLWMLIALTRYRRPWAYRPAG